MFRVGDIVEVQLSFVGVPIKEKCRKMLVVLRSMALLDGQFSMVRRRAPNLMNTYMIPVLWNRELANRLSRLP